MEKYLKMGERYVEWIALGLGLLYLGFVAYLYVLQPPLTIRLNNRQLLPGDVDVTIDNGTARPVHDQMTSKTVDIKLPEIHPKQDLIAALQTKMPAVASTVAPRDPVRTVSSGTKPSLGPAPTLPVPPPAVVAEAPAAPSMGTSQIQQPQPLAAATAGVAATPASMEDVDWITLPWAVRMDALIQSFKAANIPTPLFHTLFLRVELVRQERSAAGQWSVEQAIPSPPTNLHPMPEESASMEDKQGYQTYAASPEGVRAILQPDFFPVMIGTPWYAPGSPKPTDTATAAAAPPPPVVAPALGGLGPRSNVHPLGEPAYPYPGPGMVPPRTVIPFPPRGPIVDSAAGPAAATTDPGAFVGSLSGAFDPAVAPPEAIIYTHDWTVQGGHTYRYKLRYRILNPLFLSNSGSPKDRETLSLVSPYSDWAEPVSIPSRYQFFVQKFQKNNNNDVFFDLFFKRPEAPGGFEKSTVRVAPGDSIGPSGSLLVDVRLTSDVQVARRSYYFVVADASGFVERRDVAHDKDDPAYKDLLERTGGSAGIGAAAPTGVVPTGVTPPPINPRLAPRGRIPD